MRSEICELYSTLYLSYQELSIKLFKIDKALDPDGCTMGFFEAFWEVLKVDITNVFHDFHARGMFGKTSIPPSFLLFRINQGLLILRIFDLLA
jgi:hypothetical protein